ncbi:hypothetical protein [Sinomicrobium oceani]|uniref:hypothetical protein n=1 Tax=Sinomicrobium oceani TaxID=1150368 RepID=UPI0009301C08|nr:hypothetical protein [Sinomicrobium oceani]
MRIRRRKSEFFGGYIRTLKIKTELVPKLILFGDYRRDNAPETGVHPEFCRGLYDRFRSK